MSENDIKLRQTTISTMILNYAFEVFYCGRILQNYELLEFYFIDFKTFNMTPRMFHTYIWGQMVDPS